MTPKQEALRIFNRFYNETLSHLSDHITREDAIQSALICVDEIIKSLRKDLPEIGRGKGFWSSVKQEIKNLR